VDHTAQPYIPFKSNSGPSWGVGGKGRTLNARIQWKRKSELWRQMYHYYEFNHKWFMQQYHKRSNVESTFSMIKAKFGDGLCSKTKTAQVNEALCKILAHNICCLIQSMYELNIKPEFGRLRNGATTRGGSSYLVVPAGVDCPWNWLGLASGSPNTVSRIS
jgi:hypothetical protein